LPLKVLQHFEADEEWVLEPGDMLYLPPHIAHDGVAEGECMTASIGFRAPSASELSGQFLYHLAECLDDAHSASAKSGALRYRDPAQPAVSHPALLPQIMIDRVGAILANIEWNEKDVASFLGTYLSEPKPNVVFDPPRRPLNQNRFIERAKQSGLKLDKKTVLLYDTYAYFMNGEQDLMSGKAKKWLPELADKRYLEGKRFVTLSGDSSMTVLLHEWYCAGWIQVDANA
jgi:50S ribosomal protein L16 3-hydroxylase